MRKLSELKDFAALKIYLASSEDILSWSYGEITKPETINYRTFRPERDGLFDERIFGPIRDYHCYCGKYKGYRYKGVICDKCGVEVAHSRVRRERMGHLKLACPVVHVWFFKGIPSKLALLLDISPRKLESVIYFSSFVVTKFDPAKKAESISKIEQSFQKQKTLLEKELNDKVVKIEKPLKKLKKSDFKTEEEKLKIRQQVQALREEAAEEIDELERQYNLVGKKIESIELHSVLTDVEYLNLSEYVDIFSEVSIGADAIKEILGNLDLADLSAQLREDLEKFKGQKVLKVSKRLKVVEGFRKANIDPARIVLDILPVIPPELRPMVQLEGGRFATSDSNDLYRRVINRNNRLKKLLDLGAPEIIVRNEKRMLQESVDALIDSSKQRSKARSTRGRKQLKSLADQLKGKQGRFRQNLLGKRVDYSGRGVIINGPDLKLNECGIPKEMALELFKPFVLRELLARGLAPNVKSAKFVLEARGGEIWDILEELVTDHPVLLNRQPTLWRLGIQAFYPKLIDGNAIRLHLCVCPGYNADFDGDQMAVLLPLSEEAIEEAKTKMLSTNNLRRPSDGIPFSVPTKIILYGIYYITSFDETLEMPDRIFGSNEEVYYVMNAEKSITVRQKIKVRVGEGEIIETTAGRLIYNDVLPENFDFINKPVGRTEVNELMTKAFETETNETVVNMIDDLKDLGIKYGTLSGNSISLNDIEVPEDREKLIDEGKDNVADINKNLARGLITEKEATRLTENVWDRVTTEIDNRVWDCLKADNPVKMLIESKATRASRNQITQIAGIRGLVFDATGKIVSVPLLGNYKIGLTAMEYFIGARGARKGLVDKGLKTADAGYLTRKLVDVAQEVIVREEDCRTENGRPIEVGKGTVLAGFPSRYEGRLLAKGVKHKGKVIFKRGRMLTLENLEKIEKAGVKKIFVRSPLDCETRRGICSKCYGHDIMTQKLIVVGSTAGVTAAQSIGEPGTQLTMRTFHTGGIAGKDITQGLPRIEELVEARAPKFLSTMSDVTGTVKVSESGDERKITVIATDPDEEEQAVEYAVDPVAEIVVENNQLVAKGERLTSGHLNLTDLLRTVGVAETKKYIIEEVQKVYASQGVSINEKHIEIIVKQMFGHVKIEESGDTDFLPNSIVTKSTFEEENEKTIAEGGTPATAGVTLLGITKASLNTDSFLSAASFIQTSQVLTDAAASGKVDMLYGLKENVIIGRLIPTDERARMDDDLDEE